jgi:hypothetical protein
MAFRRAAGDVAAGGRGQSMPVEPLHEVGDLGSAGFELHGGSFWFLGEINKNCLDNNIISIKAKKNRTQKLARTKKRTTL